MYKFETICSIGLGYVGLPSATMFALYGKRVIGVDINEKAVELINQGLTHIEEPDLDAAVKQVVQSGNLSAQTTPAKADVFFITVPTPIVEETKAPDMAYVISATESLTGLLEKGNLVVLESTSPVGATQQVIEIIKIARPDLDVEKDLYFAYCPERILPGETMRELIENSRTIGGYTPEAADFAADVFSVFCKGEIVKTTAKTAEMCKLVENSFRDTNIAFANELSMICHDLEIDVKEVIRTANKHPRVDILDPGPGVGGHCLPIDPWFIVASCPEKANIIRTAREVNTAKTAFVADQIKKYCEENSVKKLGLFGISYKPNVDDPRESPSIDIINHLAKDLDIVVVDPYYQEKPKYLADSVEFTELDSAMSACDICIILTEHAQFLHPDIFPNDKMLRLTDML